MGTPADDAAPLARTRAPAAGTLDGPLLRRLFVDADSLLERHIEALNAINVFPVPDGDTGTNMHLTLRSGVQALESLETDDLPSTAQALAHGALMGARGNSGVILSQVLRGFAAGLDKRSEADGRALASALSSASDAAYAALSEPAEGTILTVVREAAEAVAREQPAAAADALALAAEAAQTAVERTPELLPVLKEAGVVDAGGLGLAVVLAGLVRSLRGETLDVDLAPATPAGPGWQSEAASMHRAEHGETGYCTEFMVAGSPDVASVRAHLATLGGSVLAVAGGGALRVHVHTTRPDDALAYGRTLGELSNVKVDNMEAQMQRFAAAEPAPALTSSFAIVAVAAGAGIEAAFRSVGVTHVVRGGQTMNPSAGEILRVIEESPQGQIAILPNNKNIIAAAEQAAEQTSKQVAVLPSRSVPQAVAAVLAVSAESTFEENVAEMERALQTVRSAEVTRAVRSTTIEGRKVGVGQAIGVIDGALRAIADDLEAAVIACADEMYSPDASLLTLYSGADVRAADAAALANRLRESHSDLEVELVEGGQPHYQYLLSLE